MVGTNSSDLPPGFRFHPTDEELIMFYLRNQAVSKPCPVSIIPEVDIYKFDPWELPEKTEFSENEWYFFTPRDRKYPNGVRPNRAAVSGYWKATGTDKSIYSGSKYVGVKKALVFYQGKPPKGVKSDWIMHEYRLSESPRPIPNKKHNGSMRLDDWVLCRIYKKKSLGRSEIKEEEQLISSDDHEKSVANGIQEASLNPLLPRICSLTRLWEMDQFINAPTTMSMSQLFGDQNPYNNYQIENNQNNTVFNPNYGNHASSAPYHSSSSSTSHGQNNDGGFLTMNPVYHHVNPVFEFQSL